MKDLLKVTEKLLLSLPTVIEHTLANSQIEPCATMYRRRKVQLTPTETGHSLCGWQTEYYKKREWFREAEAVFTKVEQLPEYRAFGSAMAQQFPGTTNIQRVAADVVRRIIGGSLDSQIYAAPSVCSLLEKELTGQKLAAESDIEVFGMDLYQKNIELKIGDRIFLFRQLEQADFEKGTSDFDLDTSRGIPFETHAVVLQIRMPARVPLELQREAQQALLLLRLFKVGAVEFGRQSLRADTLATKFFNAVHWPGALRHGKPRLSIKPADVPRFQRYWMNGLAKFPKILEPFQSPQPETYLNIAYDRYCDSLFHQGQVVGRLAFAVMALEALFLGREEKTDLKYRLSMRVAKLLSRLGSNAAQVRDRVREAYDIRSTYVHGGHLSARDRAKSEKRIGTTLEELCASILDYVRNTILTLMFGNTDKDDLLSLLDQSLIDAKCDAELDRKTLGHPSCPEPTS